MCTGDFLLLFMISLVMHLSLLRAIRAVSNSTNVISISTTDTTISGNGTGTIVSNKNPLYQGKEILHDAFSKMDRGTLMRALIVLGSITCFILLYGGIKTFFLRKKRQPKRYTLITNPNAMEEPLFGSNDGEEEIEDDTLFVRK